MTPFGLLVRGHRAARGITLRRMAADLQISPAYLSALEHGHRGRPSRALVVQICEYFGIIWDEAEALEQAVRLSHPRVRLDTAGLAPRATELANRLAESIHALPPDTVERLHRALDEALEPARRRRRPALRPARPVKPA